MSKSENQWIDDLSNVLATVAKANTELMKQGIEMVKGTLTQPAELSRIILENSSIISRGFVDYMRLSAEHSQRLIELGRELSNKILSSLDTTRETTTKQPSESTDQLHTEGELKMEGNPGDLCRSVFVLESNKSETVSVNVRTSSFVNIADNSSSPIPMTIEPLRASIPPRSKTRFTAEVGIPEGIPAGIYHAIVWIDGFPELNLRIILSVHEDAKRNAPKKIVQKSSKKSKKRRREK